MHRRMIFKVWFLGLAQHANSQVPSWTCWIRTTGGGLQSWVLTDPLGDSDAMLKFESPWHRTLEMVSFHFTAEWSMEEEQKPWRTLLYKVLFSSVAQLCPTLCDPMDCSTPGFPVHHQLPELISIELVMPSSHLILCRPLLLPPSIFPSIRVFSNESVLHIRWPKDWSFSFYISPSNEHPGLISFRMDWLDFLAVQGTLKSLL